MPRPPPPADYLAWFGLLSVISAVPSAALAQDSGPSTIIVTARRADEPLAEVPLAVEVVRAAEITQGSVDDLQSLAARVPSLSFEAAWGGFNSFPVLRGQSQPSIAGDNVGMFVDGVYQANRDALGVVPLDLDRIEIVEGPQSALFGHSTFAGLIHYIAAQPTEALLAKASAEAGSANLRGASATVSGPVNKALNGRAAISWLHAGGTWVNAAAPDQRLGDTDRLALSASVATRSQGAPLNLRLSGRYGSNRSNQPPFFALDYRTYNCGGRDATSGAWSYYCGGPSIPAQVAVSRGLPDSVSRTGQLALHLALDLGGIEIRSDSSLYRADSHVIRDLDGTASGDLYGVCLQGVNCTGVGSLIIPVVRLQSVNIVLRRSVSAREIAQEFRLLRAGDNRLTWEIGATAFWTQLHTTLAFGAERGGLASTERLSSLVLTNPQRVGAPAAINAALVDDPAIEQVVFSDSVESRRTLALFATADYRLTERFRLHGELRSSWENLELDSRKSNFVGSFGKSLGPRDFHDLTPRISLEWRSHGWLTYTAYAKGARSGGINPVVGLATDEQTYAPETNWTAELGAKYFGNGLMRAAQLTVYDIDWKDTQVQGNSGTPGVTALIIRNTRGIRTRGIEASAQAVPSRWLAIELSWSHTNPRFKPGSEGPGDGALCGLTPGFATSSFCTLRPSSIAPGQLVPDISGNLVARVPQTTWYAAVQLSPHWAVLPSLRLHVEASHQSDVFDRQVNGLSYGARTLLGARLSFAVAGMSAELWGTNLASEHYARVAASRQPVFYAGIPRPTDLILGEGRRIGLTLRYSG